MGFGRFSWKEMVFASNGLRGRRAEAREAGCKVSVRGTLQKNSDVLQLPGAALIAKGGRILWLHRGAIPGTCLRRRNYSRTARATRGAVQTIPAPKPPRGAFDEAAAAGKTLFGGKAQCAPPIFTEPGNNLPAPGEVCTDSFQADRSPTHMYRTAPLAGLWTHQKGGFYHDGRFASLRDVMETYDRCLNLGLTEQEKISLNEYLKSL